MAIYIALAGVVVGVVIALARQASAKEGIAVVVISVLVAVYWGVTSTSIRGATTSGNPSAEPATTNFL